MTSPRGEEHDGPVIRDKRRIDPKTGEVREPAETPAPGAPAAGAQPVADGEAAELSKQLAERTADLQRLQAEYVNYRKRVERDKSAVRENAVGSVLNELLPVLDDIGRARAHEELTGGFKSVAEALEGAVTKLGLERFGAEGEPFDPTVHEALMHSYSPEVTETSVVGVLQPGYRIGERILRPARVAVADPEPETGDGSEVE
ncbi:nucleotide exchange factor GrpE [Actinomadura hibisca]|uniref:nucleotide exchange factor GrpE n=1 Tax=Actinomadura hibisca TaxID=68565 RepID=UPI00082F83D4|nr:nucleotide exchange factor GrpE [Actinomadura hibisca]